MKAKTIRTVKRGRRSLSRRGLRGTRSRAEKNRLSGFTMIELMIIIVIIGIAAAMAVPSFFRSMPRIETRSAARGILNYVRLARSRAVSERCQFGVYIDVNGGQYVLFKDTINPPQETYNEGDSVVAGPLIIDPDVFLSRSTFTNDCVVFLPTGGASESGVYTVSSADTSVSYTVSVLGSTGRSKMQ
jgi:prepilin-type N-terminal cleavage/methylation domain-containing protein